MTFRAQAGEAPLAQCLIHAHGHRIGQVEGAGGIVVDHGQTYAAVRIVVQQAFRQALGLLAEDQVRAVGIGNVAVDMAGFGGKIEEGAGVSGKKVVQVLVIGNVQKGPVVQARPFQLFVINGKAHGLHQMETGAGGGAGTADVAGVLRDFGLDQHDIQLRHTVASFLSYTRLHSSWARPVSLAVIPAGRNTLAPFFKGSAVPSAAVSSQPPSRQSREVKLSILPTRTASSTQRS